MILAVFRHLTAPHSALIHCGRGDHLVERDLREALETGRVRGALLGVFEREPLPKEHWMWSDPRVLVTPHVASQADCASTLDQIACNIQRLSRGDAPLETIRR